MLNREYFRDFYYKTITPKILQELKKYGPYDRALFIECDNGFLIEFIEANEIHGIDNPEIESVPIVKRIDCPDKVYDLIVLSEKDYSSYDEEQIYDWILNSAARIVVIVGAEDYMRKYAEKFRIGTPIHTSILADDVKLRIFQFDESLRVYK